MILLNSLNNFAAHEGFFSEMQFGFQDGVDCTKASFTVLETINHMLERSSKVFSCFLDVRKAIDGILYKLFSELVIGDRMWEVMKELIIAMLYSYTSYTLPIALHPSFLKTFMSICYKWKYEFNYFKSGIVMLVNLSHSTLSP